ncbi:MAG: hypothetical protein AAF569_09245 [Pseudomonadota bacterium]
MAVLNFKSKSEVTKLAGTHDFHDMVQALPIAVMTMELENFTIDFANTESIKLLSGLKEHLDIDPDNIIGTCIDVFHKNPEHQRALLRDDSNLPHQAIIQLGPEYLDLHISAQYDNKGNYTKAILSWSIATEKVLADQETARLMQMVDKMPINVMTCDINDDF